MKKFIIPGLLLAGCLLLARQFFLPLLAERAFYNRISTVVGADRSAALQDGLHIYMCGAGSPLPDPKRGGSCLGILAGDQAFVIDAGSGGSGKLAMMGFPVADIDRIFLTHLHSDHFDGLGEMLLATWINGGRMTPTSVIGPTGTGQTVQGFNLAYRVDSGFRTEHHGEDVADPGGYGAIATELDFEGDSDVVLARDDLKITVFRVDHDPVSPAFGYRVDYRGRSVSISGDTVFSQSVIAASKDVDILFHEALNEGMVGAMEAAARENQNPRLAKIFADIPDYHTTPVDAARAAKLADADSLVLYHIVPMLPSDALIPAFLKGTAEEYSGDISVSQDGDIFRMPAGSDRIVFERGL